MTIKRWFLIPVLIMTTLAVNSLAAQAPGQSLVVFIVDDYLQNASARDPGPYGLYQLEEIFIALGAQTTTADLQSPLPEDADVVVLIGPKRRLPGYFVINLWLHLNRGRDLLLALDPPGQFGTPTDRAEGTLAWLLDADFGIAVQDALVAEPWFSTTSIAQERTSFSRLYPEAILQHLIVSPLVDYDLPVTVWGARPMAAEPLTINSRAVPLLMTHTAFSETNPQVYATGDAEPAPVAFDPADDGSGPLIVGALAENPQMGARVVVLGDAEIVQSGFGLSISAESANPLYPGNRIFAERVARWLLDLPLEGAEVTLNSFTSVVLDGETDGRDNGFDTITVIDNNTAALPEFRFQRVSVLHDSGYLYLTMETAAAPRADVAVRLELTAGAEADSRSVIWSDASTMTVQDGAAPSAVVPDGKQAVGTVIETRIPLRIITENAVLDTICLADAIAAAAAANVNCISPQLELSPNTDTVPLDDASFTGTPFATVLSARANLRDGPDTNARLVTILTAGQYLVPVGRNQAATWIKVQNATYEGWIGTFLVALNTDVRTLPVVAP